jgi:predicted oxidoreductase
VELINRYLSQQKGAEGTNFSGLGGNFFDFGTLNGDKLKAIKEQRSRSYSARSLFHEMHEASLREQLNSVDQHSPAGSLSEVIIAGRPFIQLNSLMRGLNRAIT